MINNSQEQAIKFLSEQLEKTIQIIIDRFHELSDKLHENDKNISKLQTEFGIVIENIRNQNIDRSLLEKIRFIEDQLEKIQKRFESENNIKVEKVKGQWKVLFAIVSGLLGLISSIVAFLLSQ